MTLPLTRYAYVYQLGDDLNGDKPFQHLVTMDVPVGYLAQAVVTSRGLTLKYGKNLYCLPLPGEVGDNAYRKAPKQPYIWRSKKFVMPGRLTLAAGRVARSRDGDCLLKLYVDGRLVWESLVLDARPFTIPDQIMGKIFEVELQGTARVTELHLAPSMKELMDPA